MPQSHEMPSHPDDLSALTPRQLEVVKMRNGFSDGVRKTRLQVADQLQISVKSVRKLEERAKLRVPSLEIGRGFGAKRFSMEDLDLLPEGNTKRLMMLREGFTDGKIRTNASLAKELGITRAAGRRIARRAEAMLKATRDVSYGGSK